MTPSPSALEETLESNQGWTGKLGRFVEDTPFQRLVMALIVLNGITLGLATSPSIVETAGGLLRIFDALVLVVFVFELFGKLVYRRLYFFHSGWNIFDFIVVGIAVLPTSEGLAVLRALRILRVLRLISVVPSLRRVVRALFSALPGMAGVVPIILLIFYVAAVLSTKMFAESFPEWFGSIGASMYTLFQIMTLESWSMGIVRPVMDVYPHAWLLFVPFIVITSFAVLNLFIGIIVDSMQTVHQEEAAEAAAQEAEAAEAEATAGAVEAKADGAPEDLAAELRALRKEMAAMRAVLDQRNS